MMNILESISDTGLEIIPQKAQNKSRTNKADKRKHKKNIPGWKEYVEPYQDQAHFWHSIWVSAGKPINTELHNLMKKTRNEYHFKIRKCKRLEKLIINRKLIENCFENDLDIFAEIKKARKTPPEIVNFIDGSTGDEIPNTFGTVYSELFNRIDDDHNLKSIKEEINRNLSETELKEIEKIDKDIIKEALNKIKTNKSDPVFDFSSDFLKNGPDLLYEQLANIMQQFLIHGYISEILLLATLVPIVKDKLSDLTTSKNYRSIAISSLLLKLLDHIIIILYGDKLKFDEFQFGYQENISASLCSWIALETISLYQRQGTTVYGCFMDCTKAFDTVQQSKFFTKLLEAKIPSVIIRLLIHIYRKQTADVRWQGKYSTEFKLSNGVRQGSVLSPILFCFYMNGLFNLLKKSKNGCVIGPHYSGVFGYADDLFLICPSRGGLQEMLNITQRYAEEHNIGFSTNPIPKKSKTKGLIFKSKTDKSEKEPVKLKLCENQLPWVSGAKYLGNFWTNEVNGLLDDILQKRARNIERNCELNQEFWFAHPDLRCKLNRIYNSSYPGSVLWDLTSDNVKTLVNSWSVSVRQMWNLPREAHKIFIEPLGGIHAKTMHYTRFLKFIESILKGNKAAPIYLFETIKNNTQTVTGRNIRAILNETEKRCIEQVTVTELKEIIKLKALPDEEKWKVTCMRELTNVKQNNFCIVNNQGNDFFTKKELDFLISDLATS